MSNLFDFNARADDALIGGAGADSAIGLPQPPAGLGGFAPPGAQGAPTASPLDRLRARRQELLGGLSAPPPAPPAEPIVGYNPTTNRVFSAGAEFDLDVGPGLEAAQRGLLDQDNPELPPGYLRVRSSQVKNKLKALYEGLGAVDATQRRLGQMAQGFGSTIRDLTGDAVGQGLENYGAAVARNNPSQIGSVSDIPDMPGQFAAEAAGQVVPDVATAVAGSAVGAKLGAVLAPATLGVSVPIGAILGGAAGRFLPSLFETYGSIRSEQRAQGVDERGRALGAASGSAALEALLGPEAKFAGQVARRGAREAAEASGQVGIREARDLLGQGAVRRYGREALVQGVVEGGTEVPQTALERFGAMKPVGDAEGLNEMALGAAFGAAGGAMVSPLGARTEYQQAREFIQKFNELQAFSADPANPAPQRLAAARVVQDIYRGQSADPQLQAEIDAFRGQVEVIERAMSAEATTDALATGAPVNLLSGARDMAGNVPAQTVIPAQPVPQPEAPAPEAPLVTGDQASLDLFDAAGQPTYAADPTFNTQQETVLDAQEAYDREMDRWRETMPTAQLVAESARRAGELQAAFEAQQVSARQPLLQQPAPTPTLASAGGSSPTAVVSTGATRTPSPAAAPAAGVSLPRRDVPATRQEMDELDAADDLEATVKTELGKVKGKVTIPQNVLAALVRALRSARETTPVVYSGRTIDAAATAENAERMRSVLDAARGVFDAANALFNAQSNAVPSESALAKTRSKGAAKDLAADFDKAQKVGAQLSSLQARTLAAINTLRDAAGSDINVEALIAVLKGKAQAIQSKSVATAERDVSLDTVLSRAWAMYKDGTLANPLELDAVRGRETRLSREQQARGVDEEPLRAAAEQGAKRNPKAPIEKGLLGVLNRLQTKGTGYERLLASSITRALRRAGQENAPQPSLQFIDAAETPRYDPKTNTVYIHETASPEEQLHESLHAALQWYVYQNPNAAEVVDLRAALQRVLDFDGPMPPKAREVVEVLRRVARGRSKTAELDAVLELISYGATLRDFRNFLKTVPTEDRSAEYFSGMSRLWRRITLLVQRFLGVTGTLANDILDSTIALLEQASVDADGPPKKRKGSVLKMDPASGNILYGSVQSTITAVNEHNYEQYAKRWLPQWMSTQFLFKLMRWDERVVARFTSDDSVFRRMGKKIAMEYPTIARWTSLVHSRFGLDTTLAQSFTDYKNAKQAGYKYAELIAQQLERKPDLGIEVLQYLDGDTTKLANNEPMRELADKLKEWRDKYVQDLPEKQRDYFMNLKFSEGMVFADSISQVASRTFGASDLRKLAAVETRTEADIIEEWLDKNTDGSPVLSGRFVQVLEKGGVAPGQPAGFMSEWVARQMMSDPLFAARYSIDTSKVWQFAEKNKSGYKFEAARTLTEAMKEPVRVANALRNTMAILANTYASVEFSNQIAEFGYNSNGEPTARAVVFDNEDAVNKALGYKPAEGSILNAGDDEARSRYVLNLYRSNHQWVRIPKGAKWGPLAGKLVQGSVWNAIQDMSNRQPMIGFQVANDAMRYFKKAKTVYNPGTHITNVATNFTLAMLHDISPDTIWRAARLFTLYNTAPGRLTKEERRVMLAFMDSNAMIGDFSSVEVKQAIYDAMRETLAGNEQRGQSRVGDALGKFSAYEKAKAVLLKRKGQAGDALERADEFMTQLYSAEDNTFRLAAFLTRAGEHATRRGGAPLDEDFADAGNFAKWAFLDYDIDSYAVRALRQTVLPFVSWTYAITPVIGHIALHKPWKLLNLMAGYWMLEQALLAATGDSEEEDEAKRKVGPEFIRNRLFGFGPYTHVRVPFMGDEQNPVYYRLGAYIPLTNYADVIPNSFMGLSGWPAPLTPGGPFITTALALAAGVDPYTGRDLAPTTASSLEDFGKRAQLIVSQFVPNLPLPLLNEKEMQRLVDLASGKQGVTGVDPSNMQLARWFGLKAYDYHLGEAAAQQQLASRAIQREFEVEIAKLRRAESRYEQPDWEGFMKKRDELMQRMNERMAQATGDEE